MEQVVEIAGALLVLCAYAAYLMGRWRPQSLPYLALNFAGGLILAVVAALGDNWGFLLLQGVWALAAAWGLAQRLRGRGTAA